MDNLFIEGTKQTPEIIFQTNGKLEISGYSFPALADIFYNPVFDWLNTYIKSPQKETTLSFKMVFFDELSSLKILDIIKTINKLYNDCFDVKITWYYSEDDYEMEDFGEDYSSLVEVPFELRSNKISV